MSFLCDGYSFGENEEGGSGQMTGYMGYEKRALDRGKYEVLITCSKSKQGTLRKTFIIE